MLPFVTQIKVASQGYITFGSRNVLPLRIGVPHSVCDTVLAFKIYLDSQRLHSLQLVRSLNHKREAASKIISNAPAISKCVLFILLNLSFKFGIYISLSSDDCTLFRLNRCSITCILQGTLDSSKLKPVIIIPLFLNLSRIHALLTF